jgi:hypothetical protein
LKGDQAGRHAIKVNDQYRITFRWEGTMPTTSAARTTTKPASLTRDSAVLGPMIHPGEMLLEEFLRPLGLQQIAVADELGISRNRLNELILGKRSVTADITDYHAESRSKPTTPAQKPAH